jgi:3-oxoacyl-[acyl-carrier protein] reductase
MQKDKKAGQGGLFDDFELAQPKSKKNEAAAPSIVWSTDEVLALGPAIAGEAEYAAALKQKASGGASLDKALGLIEWLLSPASDGISGRLLAAPWDSWNTLDQHKTALANSDIYTLRRIVPEERSQNFTG